MIKARASGSKVYLYFMKKGRQARHHIPRNSCCFCLSSQWEPVLTIKNWLFGILKVRILYEKTQFLKGFVIYESQQEVLRVDPFVKMMITWRCNCTPGLVVQN